MDLSPASEINLRDEPIPWSWCRASCIMPVWCPRSKRTAEWTSSQVSFEKFNLPILQPDFHTKIEIHRKCTHKDQKFTHSQLN